MVMPTHLVLLFSENLHQDNEGHVNKITINSQNRLLYRATTVSRKRIVQVSDEEVLILIVKSHKGSTHHNKLNFTYHMTKLTKLNTQQRTLFIPWSDQVICRWPLIPSPCQRLLSKDVHETLAPKGLPMYSTNRTCSWTKENSRHAYHIFVQKLSI